MKTIKLSEDGFKKFVVVMQDYVSNYDANFSDIAEVFDDILENNTHIIKR